MKDKNRKAMFAKGKKNIIQIEEAMLLVRSDHDKTELKNRAHQLKELKWVLNDKNGRSKKEIEKRLEKVNMTHPSTTSSLDPNAHQERFHIGMNKRLVLNWALDRNIGGQV